MDCAPVHADMTLAAIDIGTNTVLLLIGRIDTSGTIAPLVYEQRIPRLGKGVDAAKNLTPDAMQRVIDVLLEFKAICAKHSVEHIIVCGTSAVRDAHNREEFASLLHSQTGFALEILSGEDEAYWTYRGAISGIPDIGRATVVDIGGGSTEITVGTQRDVLHSTSLDVGSVRVTERFFRHDPPTDAELEAAIAAVEDALVRASVFDFAGSTLVGVAGTVTSLAILAQDLREFSLQAVTNYRLRYETVEALFHRLRTMSAHEIRQLSNVMEGRSDVIIAGTLILREIMAHFGFDEIVVSERGVRYGLLVREWERWSERVRG